MENILLTINIVLAIILVILVLFQKSEGGALGIGVSQESYMFSKTAGNFLTKSTAIVATLFIICSLGLTILSNQKLSPEKSLIYTVDDNLDKDAPKIPDNNNKFFYFYKKKLITYFHGAIYFCHWRRGIFTWKRFIISITSLST